MNAFDPITTLALDYVPAGVSGDATRPDSITYDITPQAGQMPAVSAGGWGHPASHAACRETVAAKGDIDERS